MSFKERMMQALLNKSNSYRFYKQYYEKNNKNDNLRSEFNKLKKDFEQYKKRNNEYMESYNFLFNTLFLDYELNEPTFLLDDLQSLCNELLLFVSNICNEYDLEWWLDGGNLLGAVRHQYFVPWDDDVDIGMMRKDYVKFHSIIGNEIKNYKLNDILYLQYRSRDIDGGKINSFIQLFIKHSVENKVNPIMAGVDVFPFDFINNYNPETIEQDHYNAKINYFRNLKNKISPQDSLNKLYEELNLNMEPTEKIIPSAEGSFGLKNQYKLVLFDTDQVFPLTKLKYGNQMYPAPNNPDYYLNLIYGNFRTVPKSIRRHSRINRFRDSSDSHEVFQKCLNRLKEVNETF